MVTSIGGGYMAKFGGTLLMLVLLPVLRLAGQQYVTLEGSARESAEKHCTTLSGTTSVGTDADRHAMPNMAICPGAGAKWLAERWSRPIPDSLTRYTLMRASRTMHDARVARAALAVLSDTAAFVEDRLAALSVVVAHAKPGAHVQFRHTTGERTERRDPSGLIAVTEQSSVAVIEGGVRHLWRGDVPLTESLRAEIRETLARLVVTTKDPGFERAARAALGMLDY